MKRSEVLTILQEDNKRVGLGELSIYADAFLEYAAATQNIEDNGAVCAHPRTGAPIDNPYRKVRQEAVATMLKLRAVNANRLWSGINEVE